MARHTCMWTTKFCDLEIPRFLFKRCTKSPPTIDTRRSVLTTTFPQGLCALHNLVFTSSNPNRKVLNCCYQMLFIFKNHVRAKFSSIRVIITQIRCRWNSNRIGAFLIIYCAKELKIIKRWTNRRNNNGTASCCVSGFDVPSRGFACIWSPMSV